ncbi:MAG TPA: ABC transporter substrate-binding protein [Methylomirabilota bacterium]|nr:ABC transporter substrate-binding protein [Methylomirabilota bacterium]
MTALRFLVAGLLSLGLLTGPIAADAQQAAKVTRIGFLGATTASSWASRVEAFRLGLRDLGYVEGKNIVIEFRWAEEKYGRLPDLAAELVCLKVDLLVTYGTPGTLVAKRATTKIPIVMVHSGDAVAAGIVAGLARPGGNITGSTYFLPQLMAKRLELLKAAMPHITQVAILVKPDNPFFVPALQGLEYPARALKIGLQQFDARGPNELQAAFSAMAKGRVDAVLVLEDAVFVTNVRAIADLAAKHRLPSAGFIELAEAGGLIGYGVNFLEMYRRAAVFVDKILKGAKPAGIPVEQATKFDFVINVKTAKAIGLTIPPSLLLRADRVIE